MEEEGLINYNKLAMNRCVQTLTLKVSIGVLTHCNGVRLVLLNQNMTSD